MFQGFFVSQGIHKTQGFRSLIYNLSIFKPWLFNVILKQEFFHLLTK